MAEKKLSDKQMMDLGRKYGVEMWRELNAIGATPGEMMGVASFASQGIIRGASLKMGLPVEVAREHFDQMLDIWLDDSDESNTVLNN